MLRRRDVGVVVVLEGGVEWRRGGDGGVIVVV